MRASVASSAATSAVLGVALLWGDASWAQDIPPDVEMPDIAPLVAPPETETEAPAAIADVTIDEVLKTSVYVASKKPQLVRETPGVVTVVTREEIIDSGARDLMDVLRLIPGFSFGVDVEGIVGIGFRGNWGHEGKVLLLVDGQELNELLYATLQLGNHFPVELIEKIEIIRGPGSAIYGGFAELAVVNIVTRSAKKLGGATVAASYGQMSRTYGRRTMSLAVGREIEDFSVAVSAQLGQGNRSDRLYRDINGDEYRLDDGNAKLDPLFVNAAVGWRDLRLRFLYDDYRTTARDHFGENGPTADPVNFISMFADAQYDLHLGERVTITPRLNYRRQVPWQTPNKSSDIFYDKTVERYLGNVTASIDLRQDLNLLAGAEVFHDHAFLNDTEIVGLQTQFGTENSVSYQNFAAFTQLALNHPIVNVTAGARLEVHSEFGLSFVPRVGLTKVAGRFHVKALAASAFRAPAVENINLGTDLTPERTLVFELETGAQLSDNMFASVNAYDITINSPIIYTVMGTTEGYFNGTRAGTRGIEAEFKMKYRWGYLNATWSVYTARDKNDSATYAVPGDVDALLAMPNHKGTLWSGLRPFPDLVLSPSVTFHSERHAYVGDDMGGIVLDTLPSALLLNFFATYQPHQVKGLEVGAGVYNILDADDSYAQPYDAGHPPLPGPSREILGRVAYTGGF